VPKALVDGIAFENEVPIVKQYPECFDLEPAEADIPVTEHKEQIKTRVKIINSKSKVTGFNKLDAKVFSEN
jgi:hypothetical protein